MTHNRFGGRWTADKLTILREYVEFYTAALGAAPSVTQPFRLVYIDAFAGTGRCSVRTPGGRQVIPGSASIALATSRPFSAYHFIEPHARRRGELQALVQGHALAARCQVHAGTAQERLPEVLRGIDWRTHRAVLFLDPFGLQCDWDLLSEVQRTQAVDVFYLLSVSGLFRNAALDVDGIDPGKAAALTRVLGTDEWRGAWYAQRQADLFDASSSTRHVTWRDILAYATRRLRMLFPEVLEPRLLFSAGNAPLFALYLLVSNSSPQARDLAARVGRQILNKLR